MNLRIIEEPRSMPSDPDGQNADRAKWAQAAIDIFQTVTGTDNCDALADLLCNLMHWADHNRQDFDSQLDRARRNYASETATEPGWNDGPTAADRGAARGVIAEMEHGPAMIGDQITMSWTKPYCGVQHLNGVMRGLRQVTATDHGTFSEVWALGADGFTPIWEERTSTIEEALTKGESYARSMGCLIEKKEDNREHR
jgi:hypothetical protein